MVIGETQDEIEMLTTETIALVTNWLKRIKLKIGHHKTEVLLVSNCKAAMHIEITANAETPGYNIRR